MSSTKITEEQARAQFGDAPFDALEESGWEINQLWLNVEEGEAPILSGDMVDPCESEELFPAVWCPEIGDWDAM